MGTDPQAVTHRTHGEVIGVRAERDRAALGPIPARPYVVAERHLRHVGKDCLVAFEANLYSVLAVKVFHRQIVEVRASAATIGLHTTVPDEHGITLLAMHSRAGNLSRPWRSHRRSRSLEAATGRTHPGDHYQL